MKYYLKPFVSYVLRLKLLYAINTTVLLLIFSASVQAASFTSAVSELRVWQNTIGVLGVVSLTDPFECYSYSGDLEDHPFPDLVTKLHIQTTTDVDAFNTQYAVLLNALATGQTVEFEYTAVVGWFFTTCNIDRIKIN